MEQCLETPVSVLREHETLTQVVASLPTKVQHGLFTKDVELTCVAALPHYIALGTNVGMIFLYDRLSTELKKLNMQLRSESMTCITMQESVDTVIASGTMSGKIYIFLLPSPLPGRSKQLKMFKVVDMHSCEITSICWSQNALKLFSGDCRGNIACNDINYEANQSSSYLVSQEHNRIVQLQYTHGMLLVSLEFKTFLIHTQDENKHVKIGSKDRKTFDVYGGCFELGCLTAEGTTIYTARPSLRIWKANSEGNVLATYIFKDLLDTNTPHISLLRNAVGYLDPSDKDDASDRNFGKLIMYKDRWLVSWKEGALFILDVNNGKIIGWHGNMGNILDVATTEKEIYILRSGAGRKLLRISDERDMLIEETAVKMPLTEPAPSEQLGVLKTAEAVQMKLVGSIKEKLKTVQDTGKQKLPAWGFAPTVKQTIIEEDSTDIPDIQRDTVDSRPETLDELPQVLEVSSDSSAVSTDTSKKDSGPMTPDLLSDISKSDPCQPSQSVKNPGEGSECREDNEEDIAAIPSDELSKGVPIFDPREDTSVMQDARKKVAQHHLKGSPRHRHRAAAIPEIGIVERKNAQVKEGRPSQSNTTPKRRTAKEPSIGLVKRKTEGSMKSAQSESNLDMNCETSPFVKHKGKNKKKKKEKKLGSTISLEEESRNQSTTSLDIDTQLRANDCKVGAHGLQRNILSTPTTTLDTTDTATPNEHAASQMDDLSDLVQMLIETEYTSETKSENKPSEITDDNEKEHLKEDECEHEASQTDLMPDADDLELASTTVSQEPKEQEPLDTAAASTEASSSMISITSPSNIPNDEPSSNAASEVAASEPLTSNIDSWYASSPEPKLSSNVISEDFYGQFESSSSYHNLEAPSISEAITEKSDPESPECEEPPELEAPSIADTWSEFLATGNLQCIAISHTHLWCVDKSERVHYSTFSGPGLKWHRVDHAAQQIAVAPTGGIVWLLFRGNVYAGTKISNRNPAGLKFVETARDVAYIAVDDCCAWYIKQNGDVYMQKRLSRDRPCYTANRVACHGHMTQITCRRGVVWGLLENNTILVRRGIKSRVEEGVLWDQLTCVVGGRSLKPCHIALGNNKTAWIVDAAGDVWFTTDVCNENPRGCNQWWQVSMSGYLMQDPRLPTSLRAVTDLPQTVGKLLSITDKDKMEGGLIAVGRSGVWVCPGYKHKLLGCRGNVHGHNWEMMTPNGIAPSTKWTKISAASAHGQEGLIWAQQPNDAIFCFAPGLRRVMEISLPVGVTSNVLCLSATQEACWLLFNDGQVHIRTGMGAHCMHGIAWHRLDLLQLGKSKLVHLSAASQNVWAVDQAGLIYLRIGVKAPSKNFLSPAWVPVDGSTNSFGSKFAKVYTGACDWMIWALDTKNGVYVRRGITEAMPIGTHWVYVQGSPAVELCISEHYVMALTSSGEVLVRYGITSENITGDYWKKLPGIFKCISATPDNHLWGIDSNYKLCQHKTYYLERVKKDRQGQLELSDQWVFL